MELPVEYVREHVRLGYQADTVDTAIALATTSTTRRGLYVAMTRGRDRNDVCVVTDTTDTNEARDILDTILAVDRADTPAVVIRRELAQHDRRPQPAARCEVPEWFDAYLDQARHDLAQARLQREEAERGLADARAALDAVRERLAVVDRETLPVRSALDQARHRVDHFSRQHRQLEFRLEQAGHRERRQIRREFDDTARLVDTATQRLQRLEATAAPVVRDYKFAVTERHAAQIRYGHEHTAFGNTVLLERVAVERVDALTTWQHWANGHRVGERTLAVTHRALATLRTPETADLARTIANAPHIAKRLHARRQESALGDAVELSL